jgi:hypothetical protein
MNKPAYSILTAAAMFVVTSCVNAPQSGAPQSQSYDKHHPLWSHVPNQNDLFRIPMQAGYSATSPASPAAPSGGWNDVGDWQLYLLNNGYSNCFPPHWVATDQFDTQYTQLATRAFQTHNVIGIDGIVGPQTYSTATKVPSGGGYGPMIPFTPVNHSMMRHHHNHHDGGPGGTPAPTPAKPQ